MALQHRPDHLAIVHRRWVGLLFLGWEIDAQLLLPTLPQGLTEDRHLSRTYVAIIRLKMRATLPRGLASG
ncbi:DUF2071 domain-containing protein [Verrucomicrobiales bacterium]|jgi:uncharacterized protein YqjF (DUF2071 family)|nr:DUF2071 domain-containing protein [Verrucomicrobiales bacterium]